jgi:hypothetical protein
VTRPLTPAQEAAVAAPVLHLAVLVELEFDAAPLRLWGGLGDFRWGNRVFTGAGDLLGVSSVPETMAVGAGGVTLSLSGVPAELIDHALAVDYQGRPARVWLALLDAAGALLGDPVQVLAARMDVLSWQEGAADATLSLAVENMLIDGERAVVRRYTDADQQAEYPGDKGFEYVPSLQTAEIRWGGG